jgi:hypothetical protein
MKTNMALTVRSFLLRLAVSSAIILLFAVLSRAGGPNRIAGTSYFDPTVTGQPLAWPLGAIIYYTDQGDLSPILPNSAANTLVANAFNQWAGVTTAALAAASGGQLAEDVNGSNVYQNADGTISMPLDIQSSATGTPIGIVYDSDGSVTDALMGSGAGGGSECLFNAAFGGNDNFGTFATYQHGLIVINGQCAQQSSQLTDVQYRLARTIGNVLGLGWSQLNLNVITGNPHPTSDDFAGFPLMHYTDPTQCVPITNCYANPTQLSMDDIAAISRLYPVTTQNQSNFPGKHVFSATTARIHGSVWFTDRFGNRTQPMQGVNVVARWIDPSTGQPSRRYAASSVSGFLFTGNEGNPITGTDDDLGNAYTEWGSESSSQEGFFDLAGLQLPNGGSAQYQLTVEAINSTWSIGVGPYAPYLVTPSGAMQPIVVTVRAGQDAQLDILMAASAQPVPLWATSETWSAPAPVPTAGDWIGSLSSYDQESYFALFAQANRTMSIAVTALDESGKPSITKLQPVIGIWSAADPQGTPPPAFTTSPFNAVPTALTRLDAQVASSGNFLIGIADLRGDGRPDYHYHAQVLYGDSVSPVRVSVNGGPISVRGIGFSSRLTAAVGTSAATLLAASAGQVLLSAPALGDGTQSITLTDPATGGSTILTNVLTYGAAASDNIVLLSGVNPQTAVGTQAASPVILQVLAADGVTPVPGATIGWSGTNGLQFSACGGASSCSTVTDQNGEASSWLTPLAIGTSTITATLAPGVYTPPKSVSAVLSATESSLDIGVLTPWLWVAQSATVSVPLTARVLSNGIPLSNVAVNFSVVTGSGSLSAPSAQTSASGYASVNLSLTHFVGPAQVNACVAPGNAPCQQIYLNSIPASLWNLQPVSGGGQVSTGQAFQPVVVRVVDSASPPHPVLGGAVSYQTMVMRPGASSSSPGNGETHPSNPAMPVILSVSQSSVLTDANGLASLVPSSGGFSPPLEVDVTVTAGNAILDHPLELLALVSGQTVAPIAKLPIAGAPIQFGPARTEPSTSETERSRRDLGE